MIALQDETCLWERAMTPPLYPYELNMSFNRRTVWTLQEKKTIQTLLLDTYADGGLFRERMTHDYNIVHIIKEIHTTEAGRHFNIQLCHNPQIIDKPRHTPPCSISSTIHCRVCAQPCGTLYIAKFSEIVEWL
jgi:hypothetical protein